MIDYDTTRLPYSQADWQGLLRAVASASPTDEFDWIEWKSHLDLMKTASAVVLAKFIVGMANRDPVEALERFEGNGVLLVGIEPGNCQGIDPIDPADLYPKVERFLGGDGPRWRPETVPYDGAQVLCLSVAAPRAGDKIHRIARSSEGITDGDIYVRKPGRTDRATSTDVDRLSRRLLASAEVLDLLLEVEPGEVRRFIPRTGWAAQWIENERARLMKPLNLSRTRKHRIILGGTSGYEMLTQIPEDREPEAYVDEVDSYLAQCEPFLNRDMEVYLAEHILEPLTFTLTNSTARNFASVEVNVHFEGEVLGGDARSGDFDVSDLLPRPPRIWGPRPKYDYSFASIPHHAYRPDFGPSVSIQNGGSTSITFPPVDLRPRATKVELASNIILVVGDDASARVRGVWSATSTSVDNSYEGSIDLPLASEAVVFGASTDTSSA